MESKTTFHSVSMENYYPDYFVWASTKVYSSLVTNVNLRLQNRWNIFRWQRTAVADFSLAACHWFLMVCLLSERQKGNAKIFHSPSTNVNLYNYWANLKNNLYIVFYYAHGFIVNFIYTVNVQYFVGSIQFTLLL